MFRALVLISLAASLTACGTRECVLTDPASCPKEQACEQVQGRAKPLCFAPVTLEGKVSDLSTSTGIAAAQVLAMDENGSPAGAATVTDSAGAYTLRVPSVRSDEKGAFVSRKLLLRCQAKNYLPFPSGARVSLPVDTSGATRTKDDAPYVLKSAQTDIGLSPVDAAARGLPQVSGTVDVTSGQGAVLVVLESGATTGRSTLAGTDGKFVFFNVPAGAAKVSAYARSLNYTPADVTVASADLADVHLVKSTTSTASLSGGVQLVAGANGAGTSVVLVVESTFIDALGRGEVPPGLRAPEGGTAPNITGSWTISGIPDGKYVVLAAFENDGNVRDPDPGISGTQLQHVVVSGGALTGASNPTFKVTGAVGLIGPGRDGVEVTSATPTFTWEVYSNAEAYTLRVFDSLGATLWEKAILDKATVTSTYAGPALTPGQFYQWRVTALRRLAPTSQTEELRGLFRVQN